MKKWIVEVMVLDRIEVEAATQEDAELKAIDSFDAGACDPFVSDSYDAEGWEIDDALLAEHEDREHAAGLENFDPITHIEAQEKTGELK